MAISTENRLKHKNIEEKIKKELSEIYVENRKLLDSIEDKATRNGKNDIYKTIAIAYNYLRICEAYLIINKSSIENLNKKSDNALKDARSNYSKAISELEQWTKQIQDYLTEKDEYLEQVKKFNAARFLALMKIFMDNINELYEGFKKSNWIGNLITLEGKAVSTLLYLINFKEISNPNYLHAYYDQKVQLKRRIIEWMKKVSNNFQEQYMLHTKETSDTDIKKAILLQEDIRRICSVMGEQEEMENAKKSIEYWTKLKEKDDTDREKRMNQKRR